MTIAIRSLALLALLLAASRSHADAFDRVRCDEDPAKALRGVSLGTGGRKTDKIEAAHQAIRLHFDGGDGVAGEDPYGTQYWHICDHEYVTLHDIRSAKTRDKVQDVLAVPRIPPRTSWCRPRVGKRGATLIDDVLALMPKGQRDVTPTAAWRVDLAKLTFVPVPVDGLRCSSE